MLGSRAFILTAFALAAAGAAAVSGGHTKATTSLVRGWNNVAYQGDPKPPSEALAGLSGQYNAVYRWNATTQAYEVYAPGLPAFGNSISQLNAGDALWIDVTAQGAQLPGGGSEGSGSNAGAGRVAIAASTFMPANDLAMYEKTYNQLSPAGTDAASQRYYAPVILPDGATITSMTAAYDATGGIVQVRLDYTPIGNGTEDAKVYKIVEVVSSGGTSPQTQQAFAHTVDNSANVYFLVVDLTAGPATKLRGVSIAYTGG